MLGAPFSMLNFSLKQEQQQQQKKPAEYCKFELNARGEVA